MQSMEAPVGEPMVDCVLADPEAQQLFPPHHSMLLPRQPSDFRIGAKPSQPVYFAG